MVMEERAKLKKAGSGPKKEKKKVKKDNEKAKSLNPPGRQKVSLYNQVLSHGWIQDFLQRGVLHWKGTNYKKNAGPKNPIKPKAVVGAQS